MALFARARSGLLLLAAVLAAGCGGGSSGSGGIRPPGPTGPGPGEPGPETPTTPGRGPRALPSTFVPLEVDRFAPRPGALCAGYDAEMSVGPGQSIAAALAAASPGTTIRVAPGTYVESPGEATALPWRTDRVCLRAEGSGPVILEAAPDQPYGVSLEASGVAIEGITLRGFASGIGMSDAADVALEGVVVEAMSGDFRDGVVAYGPVDRLTLVDSAVRGADLGVSCNTGPCRHWWIEGVRVEARTRGTGESGADAIAIEDGRQVAIVDTTVVGATGDGIDTKADDVVVLGARVLGVERNAIKLWRGGDVIDTVIDGSGADASLVGDAAGRYRYLHVLVAGHDPGGNGYVGTWGYDAPAGAFTVEIVSSIFLDNASGGLHVPAHAALSLRSTLLAPGGKLVDLGAEATFEVSELAAFESTGRGRANHVADPLLVDRAGHDYATHPGSPARDAAEPVAALDRDLLGGPRVRGAGPDIGPVESP